MENTKSEVNEEVPEVKPTFKDRVKELMDRYSLVPIATQEGVKYLVSDPEISGMERVNQEKIILQIITIVGMANVEYEIGLMLWKIIVKSKKDVQDVLERFEKHVDNKAFRYLEKAEREKAAVKAVKAGIASEWRRRTTTRSLDESTKKFDIYLMNISTQTKVSMRAEWVPREHEECPFCGARRSKMED